MGGLGGHMAHLSEDLDLTFNEIIDVLGKVARAEVENVTEKVDGQNLFLSVDSMGLIRTARNSSDIKRGGMTPEEYIEKWRGHPAESAFTNGFRALTIALKRLDPQTLQNLFSGGERYINMEIMYPENPNIIHYAAPQVVLHGLKYVGSKEDKEEQKRLEDLADEAFDELVSLVDAAEAEVGEELWTINGPKIVELRRLADGTALAEVEEQIREFARPLGVDATLKDLVKLYLRQFAREEGLPDDITDSMMMLLFDPEKAAKKGIKASSLKKGLSPDLKAVVSKLGTKTNSKKVIASILQPLEVAISDFAIEVLRGLQSFFVSEHDKEILRMQQELQQSIEHLQALSDQGDVKMGELIDKQLAKLKKVENVASTLEGVVFEYPPGSGKVYKLTGAFAMANQVIGRARRTGFPKRERREKLSEMVTIRISDTCDVTKSTVEWTNEMRENNHKPGRIPHQVYLEIMEGTPVIDIVKQEDAQEVIYNTIYKYVTTVLKEAEESEWYSPEHETRADFKGAFADRPVDIEIVDDEDADPVVDVDFPAEPKIIALVPGSFKPPTRGHLEMVKWYADRADEVRVIISQPTEKVRPIPGVRPQGVTIGDAMKIWELMTAGIPGIEIDKSDKASPMQVVFDEIRDDDGKIPAGSTVLLGASEKVDDKENPDWHRWVGAEEYARKDERGLPVFAVKYGGEAAAPVVYHSDDYMDLLWDLQEENHPIVQGLKQKDQEAFHASDMRYLISKAITENSMEARALLDDFVVSDVGEFLELFAIDLKEMSSMAGSPGAVGDVGGYSGVPFGRSSPAKKRRKKRRKKKKNESIDLSLVDEIYELLSERGVIK